MSETELSQCLAADSKKKAKSQNKKQNNNIFAKRKLYMSYQTNKFNNNSIFSLYVLLLCYIVNTYRRCRRCCGNKIISYEFQIPPVFGEFDNANLQ